jgi:hypothetical protein
LSEQAGFSAATTFDEAAYGAARLAVFGVPSALIEHRPARQREHGGKTHHGKAEARPLNDRLRISRLVLRRIGHRHHRAVVDVNAASLSQPLGIHVGLQGATRRPGRFGEKLFGQPLPRLAVSADLGRARRLPARDSMRRAERPPRGTKGRHSNPGLRTPIVGPAARRFGQAR